MMNDGNVDRKPTPAEAVGELKAIQALRDAAADAHENVSEALTDIAKKLKQDLAGDQVSMFDQKLLEFCTRNAADYHHRAGRESTLSPDDIQKEITELFFGGTTLDPKGWFGRNKDLASDELYARRAVDVREALQKRFDSRGEI